MEEARFAIGQHPNIDRLLLVESTNKQMEMNVIYKDGEKPTNSWEDDQEDQLRLI